MGYGIQPSRLSPFAPTKIPLSVGVFCFLLRIFGDKESVASNRLQPAATPVKAIEYIDFMEQQTPTSDDKTNNLPAIYALDIMENTAISFTPRRPGVRPGVLVPGLRDGVWRSTLPLKSFCAHRKT